MFFLKCFKSFFVGVNGFTAFVVGVLVFFCLSFVVFVFCFPLFASRFLKGLSHLFVGFLVFCLLLFQFFLLCLS